jgi:hypothetical protein
MEHTIINIYLDLSDDNQIIETSSSDIHLILSMDNMRVQTEIKIGQKRRIFLNSL